MKQTVSWAFFLLLLLVVGCTTVLPYCSSSIGNTEYRHQTFSSLLFNSASKPASALPGDQSETPLVSQAATACGSAQERFTRISSKGGTFLAPAASARPAKTAPAEPPEPRSSLSTRRRQRESREEKRGRARCPAVAQLLRSLARHLVHSSSYSWWRLFRLAC